MQLLGLSASFRFFTLTLYCERSVGWLVISLLYLTFCPKSLPSAIERDEQEAMRREGGRDETEPDLNTPLVGNTGPNIDYGTRGIERANSQSGNEHKFQPIDDTPPPFRSLLVPSLLIPLVNYGFIAFLDQSQQVLMPLMFSTPISSGGLGFNPFTIGMTMGTWGILNGIFQVIAFARVMKWLGPRKLYIFSFSCLLLTFAAFPIMSVLAKHAGRADFKVWAVLIIQLCLYSMVFLTLGTQNDVLRFIF